MQKKAHPLPRLPKLCKNGTSAYVEWKGRRFHLGAYGSPEADRAYRQWIGDFLANGNKPPLLEAQGDAVTVAVLCEHYLQRPDYETLSTSQRCLIEIVVKHLNEWHGHLPASQFGALKLRALRERLIAGTHVEEKDKDKPRPLARKTIAKWISTIRAIYRHGASLELIPVTLYQSLCTLAPLKAYRSDARESTPVMPVPEAHIEATLPHLPKALQALVHLQMLTAARPGELLCLCPGDFDRRGDVWTVTLDKHKTAHKGRERVLYFGKRAQAILKPFMLRDAGEYLFKPIEAMRERWAACSVHRRPDQMPNPKKTDRSIGEFYTSTAYRVAIMRACIEARVRIWTPYQLRHNAATHIRKEFGLEAAQILLGHASANITQIYAERDIGKALAVVAEMG